MTPNRMDSSGVSLFANLRGQLAMDPNAKEFFDHLKPAESVVDVAERRRLEEVGRAGERSFRIHLFAMLLMPLLGVAVIVAAHFLRDDPGFAADIIVVIIMLVGALAVWLGRDRARRISR